MVEKREKLPVHSVTLQFVGPLAEKMADHFFIDWLDGGLDQVWEQRLDDADIAESIAYDWDPETRTFVIEGMTDDEDEESEESETEDDDEDDDLAEDDTESDEDEDGSAATAVEGGRTVDAT